MINDIIQHGFMEALSPIFGETNIISHLAANTILYETAEKKVIPVSLSSEKPIDYLVPDTAKRLVIWFEGSEIRMSELNNHLRGQFNLSLYGWGNKSHFSENVESSLCIFLNELIQSSKSQVSETVYGIRAVLQSIRTAKEDFNKYTAFSKKQEVFLHPYFFFKMNYTVTFVTNCIEPITSIQNECC